MNVSGRLGGLATLAGACATCAGNAGVVGVNGDTTLEGGWGLFDAVAPYGPMEIITTDYEPFEYTYSWPTSLGDVLLSHSYQKRIVGESWATWSHGYTGEVFYSNGSPESVYTMPPGTGAFDAYFETGPFAWYHYIFTGYAADGSSAVVEKDIHGYAGASHVGFFTTDGTDLLSVEIEQIPGTGFAVGEMRIAPRSCPGDITGDGFVDVQDLLKILAEWGQHAGPADLTGDGVVNVEDLLAVLAAWGAC